MASRTTDSVEPLYRARGPHPRPATPLRSEEPVIWHESSGCGRATVRGFLVVLVVCGLVGAACSSDDDGGGDASASTSSTVAGESQDASYLYTLSAESGTAIDGTLTLAVANGDVVTVFSDRPERIAYRETVADLMAGWEQGFGGDPPNAALVASVGDQDQTSVVELSDPVLSDATLTFTYQIVDDTPTLNADASGEPPVDFGSANLFIDCVPPPCGGCTCTVNPEVTDQ